MAEVSKILEQLNTLIGEDLKVVSFKWLARHFSIPADLAKQVLFAFVEKHRSKVNATYLLGGWTKSDGGRRHVFQLVDGARLPESRKRMDPLTSLHVYSVQPTLPKDPAELWNTDCQQTTELFDSMVKSLDQNCLVDNRWSAVECQAAKRNPEAARKVPVQPVAEVPAAAKPLSRIAAKVDGIMAGATAERSGVAATSIAVRGSGSSSLQKPPITTSGPASVATAPSVKPTAKADPPPQKGKGGNALSTMWKKAPAKKPQKKAAAAPSAAAVDGDAAIRLAQQEQADSDSDDSDAPVAKRKATHRAAVFDDDDDDEEETEEAPAVPVKQSKPAAVPAAKARGKKGSQDAAPAKKKARSMQHEDSDEEQEEEEEAEEEEVPGSQTKVPPAPDALWLMGLTQSNVTAPKKGKGAKDSTAQKAAPTKRAPKKKAAEAGLSEDAEMVLDEEAEAEAAEEAPKSRKPSFGSVKAGAETGVKRRKVTKTVINEKGEEVTETTWEEEPAGSQDSGSVPPSSQKSASAAPAAAVKPKDAKPALRDSGAAKAGKKSASAKGKPAGPGQRGIMSFFQKK